MLSWAKLFGANLSGVNFYYAVICCYPQTRIAMREINEVKLLSK